MPKVLPVLCLSLVAVSSVEAREGFGFSKRSAMMTRTHPPAIHVSGTRLRVDGDDAVRRAVVEAIVSGDSRYVIATPADLDVRVTVIKLDATEAWDTKIDYEYQQTGTKSEWNASKGRYEKKPIYSNVAVPRRVHVVNGKLEARYEIRDAEAKLLDSGALDGDFREKYGEAETAPSLDAVRTNLVRDAAHALAARVVPTIDQVNVVLPKGSFESLIPLAENGRWEEYLEAVEALPESRSDEQEAYRQYALAVAKEAVAYSIADHARASKLLGEAMQHCHNAIDADVDAPLRRIAASAKAYAEWR